MAIILDNADSVVNEILYELRDVNIQKDRFRFEQNIEKLGVIAGYEVSKILKYRKSKVSTPLASKKINLIDEQIVLGTVLRAGIPLLRGLGTIFKDSQQAFVAASRDEGSTGVSVQTDYVAAPSLESKTLILADTMLATGYSLIAAYNTLINKAGEPKRVIIVSVIASKIGLEHVQNALPKADVIVCSLDEKLNSKYYIDPGLGDAGDLLYGSKI